MTEQDIMHISEANSEVWDNVGVLKHKSGKLSRECFEMAQGSNEHLLCVD